MLPTSDSVGSSVSEWRRQLSQSRQWNWEMAGKAAVPCVFVLFGATGDLTKRKLIPALFNLVNARLLPDDFAIMGVSVDDLSVEAFRDQVSEFLSAATTESRRWLQKRLFDEQAKLLHCIQPLNSEEVLLRSVRGQYGEGILDGERVPSYRAEPGVAP